jgi:hypothetical protein
MVKDFSFEPLARLEAVAQHADEGNCHDRRRQDFTPHFPYRRLVIARREAP